VISFLWFNVPNSSEEHSRIVVDLDDATAGLSFLCPFFAYDRRKTLYCNEALGMNASDLEHMHLCSFSMLATLPSSRYSSSVKRSGMNIGISSMRGS